MSRAKVFPGILILILAGTVRAAPDEPVWFWMATCGGPAMGVEVRFDKVTILKTAFPLCQADRGTQVSQGERVGRVEFSFRPTRSIVWQGYRETDNRTRADQLLDGNIWQAGADPSVLLIGVSFYDRHSVYMNTIHIAHPGQREESEIARGLTVLTYAVSNEGETQQ